MADEKKGMGLLIGIGGPKLKGKSEPDSGDDMSEDGSHEDMLRSAANDLIEAVHNKDADAAVDALTDFCNLHKSGSADEDEGPSSDKGY